MGMGCLEFSVFNVWQIPNLLRWLLSKEWGSKTKIKLNKGALNKAKS